MTTSSPADQAYQADHSNEDRGPMVVRVSIALTVIVIITVMLRILSVRLLRLPFKWDDFLCICGTIFIIFMCIINIVSVHLGMGKHLWAIDPAQGYKIIKAGVFMAIGYCLAIFSIKMALLLTYVRIFGHFNRNFIYAVRCVMFYITGLTVAGIIVTCTQCIPTSYFWAQFDITRNPPAQGHCPLNGPHAVLSFSALSVAADFMLLILPVPMVWRLQMPLNRKISLLALFLVGIFSCVAGIFRLTTTLNAVSTTSDSTWNNALISVWTIIEAAVQLFCACVLVIGPLIIKTGKAVRSSISTSRLSGSQRYSSGSLSRPRSDMEAHSEPNMQTKRTDFSVSHHDYSPSITVDADQNDANATKDGQIIKKVDYSIENLDRSAPTTIDH